MASRGVHAARVTTQTAQTKHSHRKCISTPASATAEQLHCADLQQSAAYSFKVFITNTRGQQKAASCFEVFLTKFRGTADRSLQF